MSDTINSAQATPEEAPEDAAVTAAPSDEIVVEELAEVGATAAEHTEEAASIESPTLQATLSEPAETVEEFVAAAVEATAPDAAAAVAESSAGVTDLPAAAEMTEPAQSGEGADEAGETVAEAAAPAESAAEPRAERGERGERRGPRGPRSESPADADRVVRTLAIGQEIEGTVKRVSEFGAFVDIGVGRDGLVHISELSIRRVGKVTDVVNEGDKQTFWIKKLDRERNRISLTMIPPGTTTMRDLNKDDLVTGTVTRILPYGAFIDIGVGRDALLHVREMGNRFIAKPEEVVKVGEQIEARIIEIQKRRGRIDLSIKGLRDEPEPEIEATVEQTGRGGKAKAEAEPEPEVPDTMANFEVLSPMELAFMKARQASGVDTALAKSKAAKTEAQRQKARQAQEEAFQRTLKQK